MVALWSFTTSLCGKYVMLPHPSSSCTSIMPAWSCSWILYVHLNVPLIYLISLNLIVIWQNRVKLFYWLLDRILFLINIIINTNFISLIPTASKSQNLLFSFKPFHRFLHNILYLTYVWLPSDSFLFITFNRPINEPTKNLVHGY